MMSTYDPRQRIILDVDQPTWPKTAILMDKCFDHVGMFKFGQKSMTAILDDGTSIAWRGLQKARTARMPVMWDAKLGDIPDTVSTAVRNISDLRVWGITVLANEGIGGIRSAVASRGRSGVGSDDGVHIIGVTWLTSRPSDECQWMYHCEPHTLVHALVEHVLLKYKAHAVVCSPLELEAVNGADPLRRLIRITPGVRPRGSLFNDQRRVMRPGDAVRAGAHYVVIGRPITQAENPATAAQEIADEIATAEANHAMI